MPTRKKPVVPKGFTLVERKTDNAYLTFSPQQMKIYSKDKFDIVEPTKKPVVNKPNPTAKKVAVAGKATPQKTTK